MPEYGMKTFISERMGGYLTFNSKYKKKKGRERSDLRCTSQAGLTYQVCWTMLKG
jgi:hypothetical protein